MVPRWVSPLSFHTAALSTRPPSSGSPGIRLITPTSRLVRATAPTARPISPPGATSATPKATADTASDEIGPTTETQNSWRGLAGSPSMDVMPPRKCSVIEVTGSPKRLATSACEASWTSTER